MLGNYQVVTQLVASGVLFSSKELVSSGFDTYLLFFAERMKCHRVNPGFALCIAYINHTFTSPCDRLFGLVVRVPGYRSRGPCSIPSATRFSEK
jgi:hypothetical protein